MGFFRHYLDATSVHPAIIEIEQRANGHGQIEGFIRPSAGTQRFHILHCDLGRVMVHPGHEPQQGLFPLWQRRPFKILEHAFDQLFTAQQFRCDRSVILRSERAVISGGSKCRNQLAHAGAQRPFAAHHFLSEARQMVRRLWPISEQVPDHRILFARRLHGADAFGTRARLRMIFNVRKVEGPIFHIDSKRLPKNVSSSRHSAPSEESRSGIQGLARFVVAGGYSK